MPLEIVFRRPRRASFTVYVTLGSNSQELTSLIYRTAAPCVPDETVEHRCRVFHFFVEDGPSPDGAIDRTLEELRRAETAGWLRYRVAFTAAPVAEKAVDAS